MNSRVIRAWVKSVGGAGVRRASGTKETLPTVAKSLSSDKKEDPHVLNHDITPESVNNRNPRNLEKLRIAYKVSGWDLEKADKSFWNKIAVEFTGKHITAKILHCSGQVPVSVSTSEWCIKRFLYSTKDSVAAKTIGQVLAHRCLQLGITEVACFFPEEDRRKEKVALILSAMEEGGVCLEEPEELEIPRSLNDYRKPEIPWQVHEDITEKLDEAEELLTLIKKKQKAQRS